MTAEVIFFEKLLVVIWHSNQVEFGKPECRVNPRWMHISMNHALLVNVSQGLAQLAEYAEHLISSELLFAIRFPSGYIVWSLRVKYKGPVII